MEKTTKKTPKDALAMARKAKAEVVDYRFTDLLGTWQHVSNHISELSEKTFTAGVGFDGSSIRGFQAIHESDMLLMPDPNSAFIDPMLKHPTLVLICNIKDPISERFYTRDPRHVGMKAEAYLAKTGIATGTLWGPEAEFFVFDNVQYDLGTNGTFYRIDSGEGVWNTGRDEQPNLGSKVRYKEGYFPCPPVDTLQDFRSDLMLRCRAIGIVSCYLHHHEVATAGQCELGLGAKPLTAAGDQLIAYKYMVKNIARERGKTVTFMPKPIFGDNGNGMHTHQSLWKGATNLFYDAKGYAGLSKLALWYVGGLLKHAPALCGFCSPTTNSYKRLVPGYEAPVNLAYSKRNRSASVRIPTYTAMDPVAEAKSKRIEYRPPDPSCNGYLAFAALLMAGIDGIQNKIDPGKPLEKDIYELSPGEAAKVPQVPGSLDEALSNLEKDHKFLLKGDVFTEDLLETWISYKRKKEADFVKLRPHPAEFHLYYDC
ncbi:MAG: type I glutamate--ammonia ligase [Candidatus Lindowbacteria bacterium RIFCSPLOWO2_12_FULL_62_27]|nr:MAG: type I glutamate--ammonia ligase [Candidatus Lindowbacteria bacterium RIFCSPLOWO2_02_FULL_62_12]OGH59990.1 MAG: type I glutamate--ammonia ligase [Candidatus Lindowbacteria bacterium RIFCSPLOWO2_12_FULL_62_27]